MKKSPIRPLSNRIVVQRIEETVSAGGIFIPHVARETPQRARVIAVGPGKAVEGGGRTPMGCKPGQLVLCGLYSGADIHVDGEKYQIVDTDDVLAVLDE